MACALSIWLTLMHSGATEEIQKVMAMRIEKFDKNLGVLLEQLKEDDLLILTADHGNDPTYTGSDHTREYVPFIAYSEQMENGGELEGENTFAVIGASIAENFDVDMPEGTIGHSILEKLAAVQTNQVNHLLQLRRVISSNCQDLFQGSRIANKTGSGNKKNSLL